MRTVGLLHPGEMGASVGAALRRARVQVPWVSAGRGAATRRRAQAADLTDAGTLPELDARSQLVMSVGPPHAATDVARTVAALGFGGIYVDANAVAPTDLEAVVLAGDVVAASALKMCYAAWTKETSALLLAIRAAAAAHRVEAALAAEWERTQPGLAARSQAAAGTARKAWRFAGEMDQIAACLAEAGLPDGFASAAAELYRRPFRRVRAGSGLSYACLTMSTEISTAGVGPLFSSQCVVFLSSGQPTPGP